MHNAVCLHERFNSYSPIDGLLTTSVPLFEYYKWHCSENIHTYLGVHESVVLKGWYCALGIILRNLLDYLCLSEWLQCVCVYVEGGVYWC